MAARPRQQWARSGGGIDLIVQSVMGCPFVIAYAAGTPINVVNPEVLESPNLRR